jgi:hypothetical protein
MRTGYSRIIQSAAICAIVAFASGAQSATITPTGNGTLQTTVTTGNIGDNTNNVFFAKVDDPVSIWTGNYGAQDSPLLVFFNSFGVAADIKDGFAAAAANDPITHLKLSLLPGYGFSFLQFNAEGVTGFNVVGSNGGSSVVTDVANSDKQFLTIKTSGPLLTYVELFATGGAFTSFKQFELDYVLVPPNQQGAVPEPTTWAMMMLGFAGLAFGAYRRRSRKAGDAFSAA